MVSTSISNKIYLSAYFTVLPNARNNPYVREISQILLPFVKSAKMLKWWQKQFGMKNLVIQQIPGIVEKYSYDSNDPKCMKNICETSKSDKIIHGMLIYGHC